MHRLILIAALFAFACNSATTTNTVSTNATDTSVYSVDTAIQPTMLTGCYEWAVNKDTATMKLVVTGKQVTGNLAYDWSEKDRNRGTLNGVINDSLIVANYTFQSEGMTSVREVVFKINGTTLTEGFGDVDTSGDTVKFKNPAGLQFQNDRPFKKTSCD